MMNNIFFYIGGTIPLLWGVSHLFPTKSVVKGFGDISKDNKHIITMEWILEGIALIFIGTLTIVVTYIDPTLALSKVVYWLIVVTLNAFSIISMFTGARINFLPFRLCPIIFTSSSILIISGMYL